MEQPTRHNSEGPFYGRVNEAEINSWPVVCQLRANSKLPSIQNKYTKSIVTAAVDVSRNNQSDRESLV